MNLEKLNVQELSAEEAKNTEGGFWFIAAIIFSIACYIVANDNNSRTEVRPFSTN